MSARLKIADWSAGLLAVLVLALGGLVVIKPALDHWSDLYRGDPFGAATTTQIVKKEKTGAGAQTTTITDRPSQSAAERVLGRGGMLALRLGIVALVALLAAFALRRAILGHYPLMAGAELAPERAPSKQRVETAATGRAPFGEPAPALENGSNAIEEPSGGSLASAIATLVVSRREALGLSQRELAKRAGVSHTVISRIESGQHAPSVKTVERLADALR
jgi:DNA-binding XRE family transcriptional regulator